MHFSQKKREWLSLLALRCGSSLGEMRFDLSVRDGGAGIV
jgi:hypothetical protein